MKIIISGTASGIGKAIALKFLQEGHDVIGVDLNPSSFEHAHYAHVQADVAKDPLPQEDPDIVIVSHGVQEESEAIQVNLEGAIRFSKAYEDSKNLKSVLFIASSSARSGAEFPLYCASKGGLVAYMKNAATRLASTGITVNAADPGVVSTELIRMQKFFDPITDICFRPFIRTPLQGAQTAIHLLLDEDKAAQTGTFNRSNHIHPVGDKFLHHRKMQQLWDETEKIVAPFL